MSVVDCRVKNKWIKLIHTAKQQLHLNDELYRLLLEGAAGISSSKEINNIDQFDKIMEAFKKLGFTYKKPISYSNRISNRQINYIKKLWETGSKSKTDSSLRNFLLRIAHVDDVRFLTKQQASAVILALEDIKRKSEKQQ
ncbi:MAG: regulatory protein GemA [candidate division WOR-3 bacterium]